MYSDEQVVCCIGGDLLLLQLLFRLRQQALYVLADLDGRRFE